MEVIVTHTNADFDALASLILASKLYPQAQLVLPGACHHKVRDFLNQYSHLLNIKKSKHIKLDKVTKLILVDTRQPSRIGKFANLINREIPIHIYDHHPNQEDDIDGELMEIKEVGATVSIILEKIKKQNIPITPLEATITALGIYEDTGCFTFPTTTSEDISAVAYLISCGADLKIITKFLERELTVDQVFILNDLLHSQQVHQIDDVKIVIAKVTIDEYTKNLSTLVHKMMDMECLEVLFCLIAIEKRVHLIARSRTPKVDVGEILASVGGGGHKNAASATIKELTIEEVEKRLLDILYMKLSPTQQKIVTFQLFPHNIKYLMEKKLPIIIQHSLKIIGEIGDLLKVNVYVVGGFVRDLLLEKVTFDVDIVVEGDGIEFAKKLSEKISGYYKIHEKFKTATVVFPNGFKVDIASARKETYDRPAALPNVVIESIYNDILRRDFTINAMAIQLNTPYYGNLIDFVDGEKDLNEGFIRILHDKSFIDDPTRIFRAIRFASRYNFRLTSHTKEILIKSATKEIFSQLTKQRLRNEIILILKDDNPCEAISQLQEFGILKYVHPSLHFGEKEIQLFKKIAHTLFYFELIIGDKLSEKWIVYLLGLIDGLNKEEAMKFMQNLRFTKFQQEIVYKDKECSQMLIDFLKTHRQPTSNELYQCLIQVPLEVLVFIMAKVEITESEKVASRIKKHILFFLTELTNVKISIRGKDLKKFGLAPGPIYKKVLDEVLSAKLNGKLKTKKDEIEYAMRLIDKYK